eukprot:scaffold24117_cov31-Tisochrysis_lutea.AAC.6
MVNDPCACASRLRPHERRLHNVLAASTAAASASTSADGSSTDRERLSSATSDTLSAWSFATLSNARVAVAMRAAAESSARRWRHAGSDDKLTKAPHAARQT